MKENRFTAILSLALICALLLPSLALASESNLNALGDFPLFQETASFTIGIAQSAQVEDYETNKYTKLLEETCNVNLTFEVYPSTDVMQKVELMIAAGGMDLPDILIVDLPDRAVSVYGSSGYFVPLNDYIENASFYWKTQFARESEIDIVQMVTSPDGNIYTVPRYQGSIQDKHSRRIWYYEPFLTALGMEIPTTTDAYRDYLRAIKSSDPNGNGQADELPLMGDNYDWFGNYLDFLTVPFIYADISKNWLRVQNGQLSAAYAEEGWREALRYIKSLVEEGLIADISFTQDRDQAYAVLSLDTPIVGSFIASSCSRLGTSPRRMEFVTGTPLAGPESEATAIYTPRLPTSCAFITKNCDDPEGAFRLLDAMLNDEFSFYGRWGEYGVDYIDAPEGAVGAFEAIGYMPKIKTILTWGDVQNAHWMAVQPFFLTEEDYASFTLVDPDQPDAPSLVSSAKSDILQNSMHPDEYIVKIIYTAEEMNEISEIETTLVSYVKETRAAFSTGLLDIDEDWDNYLEQLEIIGLSRYLEVSQIAYDRTFQ